MDDASRMLLAAMRLSIDESLGDPEDRRIGVAFSGGVDSTLLAVICDAMGYDTVLLTVGFAGSHDVEFSAVVASELSMPHHVLTIADLNSFKTAYETVCGSIHSDNLSWIENSVAFYYVSSLARKHSIDTVVTANGIDELFCGYDVYRRAYPDYMDGAGSTDVVVAYIMRRLMAQKIKNEIAMFRAIDTVASAFDISVCQPLLCDKFRDASYGIPLSEKITGPGDMYRKHIIRRLARDVGVPRISCEKRKKALQYGSGIHKAILKIRRQASTACTQGLAS